MDLLARELGMDPMELRLINAIGQGDVLSTSGQTIEYPLPTADVIKSVMAIPLPDPDEDSDPRNLPGGTGLTTRPSHVRRGVGYAVSIKNLQFAEGFDDYAEAEVELTAEGVVVHTAAIEVGQGMVTVLGQIVRSTLGIENVGIAFDHTSRIGSAGSTSASRQTQMTGGAVWRAAQALRERILDRHGGDDLSDEGVWKGEQLVAAMDEVLADGPIAERLLFRHPGTEEPDAQGRGKVHVDFCVAAHRAVVDVDPELGLVRVVRIDTAQDVGRMLNPQSVIGQIEGGIAQGMGLAVMEELIFDEGFVRNPTFTDYLLPTALDAADVEAVIIEEPSPWGPFGAKGFAELPSISSAQAVVAAIRNATGMPLNRIPVRPQDIAGV
jgi:CO/xanthine dehydrogenase Mo-binding subunit